MKSLIFKFPIFTLVMLAMSCSQLAENDNSANKAIESIQAMSKLGTVEYHFNKIIAAKDNQWYTIGDRKLMAKCKATVVAGVDASQIQFTEVNSKEKSIKLLLPPVELITFDIPPKSVEKIKSQIDFMRGNFNNEEMDTLLVRAEKLIREDIKEFNIKSEAEKNAKLWLVQILRKAGFVAIEIKTSPQSKL
jgi:hypothetical protein